MKKVFFILQVTLLTMVVQTGFAQEVEAVKNTEEKITANQKDDQLLKAPKVEPAENLAKEKVPAGVLKAFEKKYEGADIKKVSVDASGIYKITTILDGKEILRFFGSNGEELH